MAQSHIEQIEKYQKLKQKQQGTFAKVLEKGANFLSQNGATIVGGVQGALSGDTDLEKSITAASNGITAPEFSWLGSFLKRIASLVGAAQAFEKTSFGKPEDYATQTASLDTMVQAVSMFNDDITKLHSSDSAKKGMLANFVIQLEKLGRLAAALTTQAFKYNRLLQSANDFSYWTETQLAKRRIQQQNLVDLHHFAKEKNLGELQTTLSKEIRDLESNLFHVTSDKLAADITPMHAKAYSTKLTEQVNKLGELFRKSHAQGMDRLTDEERLFLNNNRQLLAFLAAVPSEQLQSTATKQGAEQSFQEERVFALLNHLEKQHLAKVIKRRELLIQQRLIAEFDDLDKTQRARITDVLALDPEFEQNTQELTQGNSRFFDWISQLSKNKELPKLSAQEIAVAKKANEEHLNALNSKVTKERKVLASKALLLSSVALLIAGGIAISCALGPAVIIPIFLAAVITGIVALKLNSHVFKDMSTNIKEFFGKFKRELNILNVKAELAHEREMRVLDDTAIEMTVFSGGKIPLDERDDLSTEEELEVEVEEDAVELTTTKPKAKSIEDSVAVYQKLKQKQQGTFAKVLEKGANFLSQNGATIVGGVQGALSGDTDLEKSITAASNGITAPEFSWLGSFLKRIASLVGAAQAFEKTSFGKPEDYATQTASLDTMVQAVSMFNDDITKLHSSDSAKKGMLANFVIQLEKLGRLAAALTTQAFKYNRLLQSANDFSYWTETQLAKRRIQQQNLVDLHHFAKEKNLGELQTTLSKEIRDLESNLFHVTSDKLAADITPMHAKAYSTKLTEQVNKLGELFRKSHAQGMDRLTDEERLFLNNNRQLLAFLAAVPSEQLQSTATKQGAEQSFQEERVFALLNHLEKQHLAKVIKRRELLIQQRLIAEFDDLDKTQRARMTDVLALDPEFEQNTQELTQGSSRFFDWITQLSKNKELPNLSEQEIAVAKKANEEHLNALNSKVAKERKILASKALLLSSVALLIAGGIAISCALGPAVIIPIFLAAVITGIVALKLNSHVFKDMSTNIKEFFGKFKRELNILNVKAELAHERERRVLDDTAIEMTVFSGEKIPLEERDDLSLVEEEGLEVEEEVVELTTTKPKAKSIEDSVAVYQKLKQKQQGTFAKVLEKGANFLSQNGATIVGGVQGALSGDTDLEKSITAASNGITAPEFSWLGSFLKRIASLVGAAQAFEKTSFGKPEDYATQTASLDTMVQAVSMFNDDITKLHSSDSAKKGMLANFVIQLEKLGRLAAALTTQAFKYNRLLQSANDFSYWTETQLAKRRIQQQNLVDLHHFAKEKNLGELQTTLSKEIRDLESNLFHVTSDKLAADITPMHAKAYSTKLTEQVNKLGELFRKSHAQGMDRLTDEERLFLNNNRQLLAFLAAVPSEQLQSTATKQGAEQSFQEERVFALLNHLEKQHLAKVIKRRELLIQQRLIAEFDDLDKTQRARMTDVLALDPEFEQNTQELTQGNSRFFDWISQLSKNKELPKLSAQEIAVAKKANEEHLNALNSKVAKERKVLASKALLLSSVALLIAGGIAISCALGPAVIIPIFLAAVITGIVALKLNSHVFKDMSTNIKEFFGKFKRELNILNVKAELAHERERRVLDDTAIEMTVFSGEKIPLEERDDLSLVEEEGLEVEEEVVELTTTKPKAKSIEDSVAVYQKLKQKQQGTFAKVLEKGANFLSQNGATIVGGVQGALSGDTDLEKSITAASNGITAPEFSWLGSFLKRIASLVGAAQAFEKTSFGKPEDYATQTASLDTMVQAVSMFNDDITKLHSSDSAKKGMLANFVIQLEKLGRLAAALTTQAFKYNRLLQSANDFSYWTETQLAKRRIQQQNLVDLHHFAKEKNLGELQTTLSKEIRDLESNLFHVTSDKLAADITPMHAKAYSTKLTEQVNKLGELFRKSHAQGMDRLTDEERLFLNNNRQLLAFLAAVPSEQLQSTATKQGAEQSFQEERVFALLNHLEKQHLAKVIKRRELLIQQRLIAEFDDLDKTQRARITDVLALDPEFEQNTQELTQGNSRFFDWISQLSKNKELPKLSAQEIAVAKKANEEHLNALNSKVAKERKVLASKALLLSSVALLIAGGIAISCALGPAVIIPIFLAAVITGIVALKLNSHVFKDMSTNIKEFFGKFKRELNILNVKAELAHERERRVLDDTAIEMTVFSGEKIPLEERDDLSLVEEEGLEVEEEVVELTTTKPKAKSIEDSVAVYQKLKQKQQGTFAKVLEKGANFLSQNGATIVGGVQGALSGDTDLEKSITAASNGITAPEFSWLGSFLKRIASLVGAAQAFEKTSFGKPEDYATQTASLDTMVQAVSMFNDDITKLHSSDSAKKGMLANFVIQLEKLGRLAAALTTQAFKYNRLLQSANDFSYWTETQLAKRRIQQQNLVDLHHFAKEKNLGELQTTLSKEIRDLESNLFHVTSDKLAADITPMHAKAYSTKLTEQVNKLGELFRKSHAQGMDRLTDEERLFLNNNRQLLAFLAAVPSEQLQSTATKQGAEQSFQEERVFALLNHLEKQHLAKVIKRRELLIQQRLIAEFDDLDKTQRARITDVLALDPEFEQNTQELTQGNSRFFDWISQLSKNKELPKLSAQEIAVAKKANEEHLNALNSKVAKERKVLASKALLLSSVALLIAGGIAISCALGPAVIIPIFLAAVITGIVALKLNSHVFKDMSTNIKEFFGKFKRELNILNVKAELAHERERRVLDDTAIEMTVFSGGIKKKGCMEDDLDDEQEEFQELTTPVSTSTEDEVLTDIESQITIEVPQEECVTTSLREKLVKMKEPYHAFSEFECEQLETHEATHCPTTNHKNELHHLKGANITEYYQAQLQTAAAAA